MKRSTMLGVTGAALATGALPIGAQESPPIRCGFVAVEEGAPVYYAQQRGFYQRAGLQLELTQFPNGAAVAQGVVAGALDVGMTNSGSMSIAHARGVPVELIACVGMYTKESPLSHIAVDKNSGIRTAKDLAGKTVAISALRDMIHISALAWIDQNGGVSDSVKFIEIPFPQMADAILAHRVDAATIVEPFFSKSRNDLDEIGYNYVAMNAGKPFQTLGLVGNSAWVDRNVALANKLAGAVHAATHWANRNHDDCAQLLATLTKIDLSVITAYPRVAFAETNSPGYVQPVIDAMAHYGVIPKPFDAGALFTAGA
jgi:NitT/TauT family transport system substrate-binding protein